MHSLMTICILGVLEGYRRSKHGSCALSGKSLGLGWIWPLRVSATGAASRPCCLPVCLRWEGVSLHRRWWPAMFHGPHSTIYYRVRTGKGAGWCLCLANFWSLKPVRCHWLRQSGYLSLFFSGLTYQILLLQWPASGVLYPNPQHRGPQLWGQDCPVRTVSFWKNLFCF